MQTSQPIIRYVDWQQVDYETAWQRQESLFSQKIEQKTAGIVPTNDFVICQHPPVFTLGRHGKADNMLLSEEQLAEKGAQLLRVNRGGDITYHGPGQLVGYPIFDLEQFSLGLKNYIFAVEQTIINLLAHYGIRGERLAGATGVWIEPQTNRARKICAIGVRASRYVTMHGFALNVNTDLRWFSYINPCGFTDKSVTSLQQELGSEVPLQEVKQLLFDEATKVFLHTV
ncbi:MAG: lipoyl(octanoyl) transferase LipB [Paludibacter sp.]|nr:lipoyl(octanoyl) transferase LipB [Bacteroidales bacterium]MCM1069456.1 lipoyl(octanoyl) transferase LipB [Prevotella sp.]MCM1353830.1 lipoyl(octanoyl) transferase LipB [Bacteroides sp.]MCM1442770.1 lipoyl(octanoyl) transferase LipB [Muribaculum sp.]MCM1481866.1 lipoyl(octanoyl) transferase LipB [Paludibacter sp.]